MLVANGGMRVLRRLVSLIEISPTAREIAWYLLAGGTNALAYIVVSALLVQFAGTPASVGTTVGYLASAVVSFVMNATLTFRDGDVKSLKQGRKFAALFALGYCYNVGTAILATDILRLPIFAPLLFVTVTWPVISFLLMKHVVFK